MPMNYRRLGRHTNFDARRRCFFPTILRIKLAIRMASRDDEISDYSPAVIKFATVVKLKRSQPSKRPSNYSVDEEARPRQTMRRRALASMGR